MDSYIINKLTNIIFDAIIFSNYKIELNQVIIEINKNNYLGDYSTSIAMILAKKYKQKPLDVAEIIVKNINQKQPLIKKINFISPGFINININIEIFSILLMKIINEKALYGKSKNKNITYNIEFISANPTGILHLGHARIAAIGDSLANILEHRGYNIIREYYINDSGNQVNILANSIFINYQNLSGNYIELPKESYCGSEVLAASKLFLKLNGDKFVNKPFDKKNFLIFKEFGIKYMLSEIKKDLRKFKVKINNWFHESALYKKNIISDLINQLKIKDNIYQIKDTVFLKTTLFKDDKDRVIIKKNQKYTYMLPDLAYHLIKFKRSDFLINIWGADHYGYIPRIKAGLYMLNADVNKLNILCVQMVKIIYNGKNQKISKRLGNTISLRNMINLIGKNYLRYFFVSRPIESHLDIDLKLIQKKTNENPAYYAQYVNARINQIFKNYPNFEFVNNINLLTKQKEKELLITLDEYVIILQRIEKNHQPHLLTNYIQKLAKLFHSYYNKYKVITEDSELTNQRLTLIYAIKQIITNSLKLIGLNSPNKM